jgi:hypothetical protein
MIWKLNKCNVDANTIPKSINTITVRINQFQMSKNRRSLAKLSGIGLSCVVVEIKLINDQAKNIKENSENTTSEPTKLRNDLKFCCCG